MELRLRTVYQRDADPRVVRSSNTSIIEGVIAMQQGEALGHNMIADAKTLQMSADLSNDVGGLPSRFGHPGMSENATGKKLARGHNFRVDGDLLRFDMHMIEAARISPAFGQDPVEYVLQVAETAPSELGMSYVLYTDLAWALDDGTERPLSDEEDAQYRWNGFVSSPDDSIFEFPVMRPTSVHFVDIVNEGALTSETGMLNAKQLFNGRSSAYLLEIFDVVDRWREHYKISLADLDGKVDHILSEYKNSRGGKTMARRKRSTELVADDDRIEQAIVDAPVVEDQEGDNDLDELSAGVDAVLTDLSEHASDEPATLSALQHLQQETALLMGTVEKLKADNARMKDLMRNMLDGMEALNRNQRRLSGEPVVTQTVPTAPRDDLEALSIQQHPTPAQGVVQPARQSHAQRVIAANNDRMRRYSNN